MNLRKILALPILLFAVALISCSGGSKTTCTSNCGGSTATLSLTLTAAPLTPPPNTNLLSFIVDITSITLTPSSGSAINIPLNSAAFSVDLTRLQSDSAFLGTSATVPAGSYTSMTVNLSSPVVTFCTQTSGTSGCAAGSVATISGAAAAPVISSAPFPLTLSAKQQTGLTINLNLSKTLTVNSSQVVTAVTLTAANVLAANTLPSTSSSLITGQLDFVQDVTGVVTAVNATTQSVTVKTATRGSLTAVANSSTVFSPNCTSFNLSLTFSSCVVQGHVASLDMVLKSSDGTLALLEYDPLATTTGDWIEGIITSTPSSSTQFQLVANDLVLATTNSVIGSALPLASPVNAKLVGSPQKPFVVDSKGLIVPANPFNGGTDTSVLAPGQTVAAHVTSFTAHSGSTLATANVDFLYLRFTRVTGTVAGVAPPNVFSIQSFPPFFALTTPITVQLSSGSPTTNFDGVASSSNLAAGQTVSITALYFGPPVGITATPTPFSAAKVRVP
jgi:uncharacterized protein DUF4382